MKFGKKATAVTSGGGKGVLVLIISLVVFVLAMAAVTRYVWVQDRYDREYISLIAEQRLLSQRITAQAGQAALGEAEAFQQMKRYRDQFAHTLQLMRSGDPETGMPSSPAEMDKELGAVVQLWNGFKQSVDTILARQDVVASMREIIESINDRSAQLVALSDEVATLMARSGAAPDQVYIASRQLMLSQRIINNVNRVMEGGERSVTAADRFGRDAALFGRVIHAMLNGNQRMGITRVRDPGTRKKLQAVNDLFTQVSEKVAAILERSPEIFQVSEAVHKVLGAGGTLLERLSALDEAYRAHTKERAVTATVGNLLGVVALGLLVVLGFQLVRDARRRIAETEVQRRASEEQNKRNQQAIIRLLDEMGNLADGDLTVNATVTEDITGAIADSINYAIDALRSLVTAINETTERVSTSSQQTQSTAMQLADASEHQAKEITSASAAVNEMAGSIEGVSKHSDELAEEAQRSVDIAKQGAEAVRKTIGGMDMIREQIQETSKRIKRLGESSQEIGDIVELINDIAEQTNILALNAAIQAAMAGEAGRGFAVVADEVQRLAERSGNATKQIEALVKTIQTDTNEAVISMEQSTSGVVNGAKLAEDAGTALNKIENVSSHLAELVQSISGATRQQATGAASVSDTMNVIQEITNQTSAGTNQTAASIGELAKLADDLKKSVSGFKLPA